MRSTFLTLLFCITATLSFAQKDAAGYYKKALQQSDLNKVVEYLTKAISLKPEFEEAYRYRGIAHFHLKHSQQSKNDLDKALQLKENDPEALMYRGKVNDWQGNLSGAENDFNAALKSSPQYAEAYYWRGIHFKNAKNNKAACDDLKKAKKFGYAVNADDMALCESKRKD